MANRPKGYGMTATVRQKIEGKYDPALEREAHNWISSVLDEPSFYDGTNIKKFQETFKDGSLLCRVMNLIEGRQIIKINDSKMAFKMMENIGNFLDRATVYGVAKTDLFQTVDLYEGQNIPQVINAIHALSRKAQANGFQGPSIGPKEAAVNKREFSEETLRSGETIIGLQMGTNKGANQNGQSYGLRRQIIP